MNIAKFESHGTSLQVPYDDLTEEIMSNALHELLSNQKYMEKAKRFAARFSDRPLTPQQSVVYWTEFVARNRDSPYIKSVASELSFIQLHLIDVYFVIWSAFGLALLLLYKCIMSLLWMIKSSVTTNVNKIYSKKKSQ